MIDPFAREALEDPYDLYRTLREDAPVFRIPSTELWLVSRHEDLVAAAADPETFSSNISAIIYAGNGPTPTVLQGDPEAIGAVDVLATADPPAHTGQRRLMSGTFASSHIARYEQTVRAFVDRALDDALASGSSIEWMEGVAIPLPLAVIAQILGMPESDLGSLRRWSDAGVDLLSGVAGPERMAECWVESGQLIAYLRERVASPDPGSVSEFVSQAATRGDLTDAEAVSLLLQLVIAGSESTASLLGSAARMLAEQPGLQDEMRAHPDRVATFVEEALRLESPFRGHFRVATREATLGGVTIPAGARVMLMWGSANRDGSAFAEPDRVDLERPYPKAHVAFGSGLHLCLGAPLARLEARTALSRLLERTASFALDPSSPPPRHVPSLFVRRLEAVHLRPTPAGERSNP